MDRWNLTLALVCIKPKTRDETAKFFYEVFDNPGSFLCEFEENHIFVDALVCVTDLHIPALPEARVDDVMIQTPEPMESDDCLLDVMCSDEFPDISLLEKDLFETPPLGLKERKLLMPYLMRELAYTGFYYSAPNFKCIGCMVKLVYAKDKTVQEYIELHCYREPDCEYLLEAIGRENITILSLKESAREKINFQ